MAQQGTEEQTSDQQSSDEAAGKHRASDEGADEKSGSSESADSSQAGSSEGASEKQSESSGEKSASDDAKTEQSAPSEAKTEKQSAPSEAKTEKQSAPSEAKTEKQKQSTPDDAPTEQHRRGSADTSWAEPETQRRHVDVGEIVWRTGNVVATVVRTLAFLFALVLIVNVVLVLVGVNPANGVAQFIGGVANTVILGFRDLFVPSDPKIALIVNSLVAAVVWLFVGELLSRLIRFVAARVK